MDIELLLNEGHAALQQGNAERALDCFTRAQAAAPGKSTALHHRGLALLMLQRFREALECFEKAAALSPDNGDIRRYLGVTLGVLRRHDEALIQLDRALALNPGDLYAMNSRGATLHGMGRDAEALIHFDRVLAAKPEHFSALTNRAVALSALGRTDETLACIERALQLNPGHVEMLHQRAHMRLRLGQFAAGFEDFEQRPQTLWFKKWLAAGRPQWRGQSALQGKNLLLWGDGGLGDILQFARYAPLAAARGARVTLAVPPALLELFKTLPGVDRLVSDRDAAPVHDLHCPLMSLPLAFGTRVESIPADIPYLRADPSRVARWKDKLGPASRPRIGLVWRGNSNVLYTRIRDIPLQRLLPLLDTEAEFISLQKEIAEDDRAAYEQARKLARWGESLGDFADTAALVENLDLVIAVDTSVVHLAGALGKPVWLLNRLGTCWRWLLDRSDTPWYPTMQIFRQRSAGDWGPVMEEIGRELSAWVAASRESEIR